MCLLFLSHDFNLQQTYIHSLGELKDCFKDQTDIDPSSIDLTLDMIYRTLPSSFIIDSDYGTGESASKGTATPSRSDVSVPFSETKDLMASRLLVRDDIMS